MELIFLRAAEADLFEIYDRSGEIAHTRLEATLDLIRAQPEIGILFNQQFRRKLVIKTSYAIFYQIVGGRILVYAVLDLRQDPDKILDRL